MLSTSVRRHGILEPRPRSLLLDVRQAINAHRVWYHNGLENLLAEDGDPVLSITASLLVALSDGLLESAYLDDAESVPALVREAVTRLLGRR